MKSKEVPVKNKAAVEGPMNLKEIESLIKFVQGSGVAEVSIYVDTNLLGMGIGTLLLHKLIQESEKFGIWTLQAGLFPENTASLKLHLSAGLYIVGKREKIAMHHGIWRDTLLLERRSQKTGI